MTKEKPNPSALYIVCGPPGAGKTSYGAALAREKQAMFLDIDTVTERIVQAAQKDPSDRDSPSFKSRFREPIHETLFCIAAENLPNLSVVIAAPFTREMSNPHWLDELTQKFGYKVEAHFLHCPPEERKRRLAERGDPRDKAKLANWQRHLLYYEDAEHPAFPHARITAS